MQQDLARRVIEARALLQEKGVLLPGADLAAELRDTLKPLAVHVDMLEFGARRKLLRICKAFDRLETKGLNRGERVRLDTEMLGLWIRID
ncbi:MAG TPA: hypothetical protein VF275_12950 [Gammaproteobacteria bacterium]